MYAFNAENENSPLIKAGSNIFRVSNERKIMDGLINKRKQFPEMRYGNNVDFPNFLNISNVIDNPKNLIKNSQNYNNIQQYQSNLINRSIESLNNNLGNNGVIKLEMNKDRNGNFSKEMEKYMSKLTNRMKNVINVNPDNNFFNQFDKNNVNISLHNNNYSPCYGNKLFQNQNSKNENSLNLHMDNQENSQRYRQNYESSPYLMNINEYDIKESYKVNEDRLFNYNKKKLEDYNCISGKMFLLSPPKYSVDKWPLFYENYHKLANEEKAFHKKEGLFTNQIDKGVVGNKNKDKYYSPDIGKCSKHNKKRELISNPANKDSSKSSLKFKNILNENFPNCPLKRNYERIWQNNNNSNFKF